MNGIHCQLSTMAIVKNACGDAVSQLTGLESEPDDDVVDRTLGLVERHATEEIGDRYRGEHHRDEEQCAEEGPALQLLVQEQRQPQLIRYCNGTPIAT